MSDVIVGFARGFAAGLVGSALWSLGRWAWRRLRRPHQLVRSYEQILDSGLVTRSRAATAEEMAAIRSGESQSKTPDPGRHQP